MKSFKKHIAEVAQPKSPEEKAFKDQHSYETKSHPVAPDAVFTGEIVGSSKKARIADVKDDKKSYDKATPKKKEDGVKLESTDDVNEGIIGNMMNKRKVAKQLNTAIAHHNSTEADHKAAADKHKSNNLVTKHKHRTGEAEHHATAAGHLSNALKAHKAGDSAGVKSAMKAYHGHHKAKSVHHDLPHTSAKTGTYSESTADDRARYDAADDKDKKKVTLPTAPWDKKKKEEELSAAQKKIDHNKNGKIDGQDLAMLRKKKQNEEVEVNETTSSAMKKMVTQTGPDGKTRTVQKKVRTDRTDDQGQDVIGEAVRFKKGPIRLKNGKQVMVSDEDAKLLTKMFKDLNPRNQKAMHKVMLMDPAGFEEIRGFAREAL